MTICITFVCNPNSLSSVSTLKTTSHGVTPAPPTTVCKSILEHKV